MDARTIAKRIIAETRRLIPYGSYNMGLSENEANGLFEDYCEALEHLRLYHENNFITYIEQSRLKSLIAQAFFYKEMHATIDVMLGGQDPVLCMTAYLRSAKIMIQYGAGNCGVAAVALYFALKEKIVPVEYVIISEDHQIIVIGRRDEKPTLSLSEVHQLDDSVLGICAYSNSIFQMKKLFADEKHVAFSDPDQLRRKQALRAGVGLGDQQHVFRSVFQILSVGEAPEPIRAMMQEIDEISKEAKEKSRVEKLYSGLMQSAFTVESRLFKTSIHDKLVAKLTGEVASRPILKNILELVKNKKYGSALRTAANTQYKEDGLVAAKILLTFRKPLEINVNGSAKEGDPVAMDYAVLRENGDMIELLTRHGGMTSQQYQEKFQQLLRRPSLSKRNE